MEIRIGGQARKDGWMKGKEGEMKRKAERHAEGPRERLSKPERAVKFTLPHSLAIQPLFEDLCGICNAQRACHRLWSLSQDNFLSICDVLTYGGLRCVAFRETLQCWRALAPLWPKGAMGASCWTKTNYCRLFFSWRLQGVKYSSLIKSSSTSKQHIMNLSLSFCQNDHLVTLCGSFCISDFCCWTVTFFNSKWLQNVRVSIIACCLSPPHRLWVNHYLAAF